MIKQQSLSETTRDSSAVFNHNLSLLTSKSETQRRDSLAFLSNHIAQTDALPQSVSAVLAKALPLILDGNSTVRTQVLKLVRVLPAEQLGPVDQALLYIRAGLTHLSVDIRSHTLDLFDWLLSVKGNDVVSSNGGWIKLLNTFQNLLSWTTVSATTAGLSGKWSNVKPAASSMSNSKLFVHQLNTLATLLNAGLRTQVSSESLEQQQFPLWHIEAHALPTRSNAYSYLNLFASTKDLESVIYESAQERAEAFIESGLRDAFITGVENARKEGGETGRAAAGVAKGISLASND